MWKKVLVSGIKKTFFQKHSTVNAGSFHTHRTEKHNMYLTHSSTLIKVKKVHCQGYKEQNESQGVSH